MLQIASLLSQVHLPTCKNNSDIVANGEYACDIIVKTGGYADQCLLSEKKKKHFGLCSPYIQAEESNLIVLNYVQ